MKYLIRPAEVTDISAIYNFICKLAEFEKLSHAVKATEEQLRQTLFGEKPGAEVLIAELADSKLPIGFALFFTSYSTFLAKTGIYLEDLFILPEHRRLGAGKALLQKVAEIAMSRHCGRLEWSVLDWNEHAIRLYESLGAEPQSEWTVYRMTGERLKKLAEIKENQ